MEELPRCDETSEQSHVEMAISSKMCQVHSPLHEISQHYCSWHHFSYIKISVWCDDEEKGK